jgi:Rrf2 family protein
MIFSKSFGYAVRGVLYIALMQDEKRFVQVEEIASRLSVPMHFMGKILKRMVKGNVIVSAKGPWGGFTVNENTLKTRLITLFEMTDGVGEFNKCVIRVEACDERNPCPLHFKMEAMRRGLEGVLSGTTLADLLQENKSELIKSISTNREVEITNEKNITSYEAGFRKPD